MLILSMLFLQVDPGTTDKKRVILYQMLGYLLSAEDRCRENVRMSEVEVQSILRDRSNEELSADLDISVYDTERNEKARKHREEMVSFLNSMLNSIKINCNLIFYSLIRYYL